jgi:hypothetical protein
MDWLYSGLSTQPSPGIICAETPIDLHLQILVRSAAAALSALDKAENDPTVRLDIIPALPLERVHLPDHEMLGGDVQSRDLEWALQSGASLLNILTHSDGIDAYLGPKTVCPMNRIPFSVKKDRLPSCQVSGTCHRHNMPIQDALRSDLLFPPEMIIARILVWQVCWGLLTQQATIDPLWGIGLRLLQHTALGAVITPWQAVLADYDSLDDLARRICSGLSVGDALSEFMRSGAARRSGLNMCLLGDPKVRLPIQSSAARSDRPIKVKQRKPIPLETDTEGICFNRAYISGQLPFLKGDLLQLAGKAITVIRTYERATWKQLPVEGKASI